MANNNKGISEEFRKKYNKSVNDEIKFGILVALESYESLNLKRLAMLINKPETTTIRYIKKLLQEELIVIDVEKTATEWGKFYRLSDPIQQIIEERKKEQKLREKWISEEIESIESKTEEEVENFIINALLSKRDIQFDALNAKQYLSISQNIENMVLNKLMVKMEEMMDLYKDKGRDYILENLIISPSDVEIVDTTLQIYNNKQLLILIKRFHEIWVEILDLKNQFLNEMDEKDIPQDQRYEVYVNSFMGSMDFSFEIKEEKPK